jgi:hypothetical protein
VSAAAERGPSVHAIGLASVGALLLIAAAVLPLDRPPLSLFACPVRAATGWPCLFCGCTHAFAHAVRGELGAAFGASPLGAALALLCAAHALLTALRLCGLQLALPEPRLSRAGRAAAVVLLAANWAFVAARVRGAL